MHRQEASKQTPQPLTYEEYKDLGGEMEEDKFKAVSTQRGDMIVGLNQILELDMGLPSLEMAQTYSQIRAEFPDKGPQWVLTETYLYLGRKKKINR